MNLKKSNDRQGLAGTILVHVIIALLMLLWAFAPPMVDDEDDGGVMVSFGEIDAGGPENTSEVSEQTEQAQESTPSEEQPEETEDPVVTNEDVDAPEVVEQTEKTDEPPEEKKPEIDRRMQEAINKLKKKNSEKSSNSGDGPKEGQQGDPNSDQPGQGGPGGGLTGAGFGVSLNGFNVSGNPVIENSTQDFGKVELDFCVDKDGRILPNSITIGRRSTTSSRHLQDLAKRGLMQLTIKPKQGITNGGCGSIIVEYLAN